MNDTANTANPANAHNPANPASTLHVANQQMLVIGSTGKTGRRVLAQLHARGLAARGGARPDFDWERPETWAPTLRGADAVYLTYVPDLAAPGAPAAIRAFLDEADRAGVTRVVLLSGRGEPAAQRCEDLVKASRLAWTIVRASWFAQNFSEGHLVDGVRAGEVVLPVGDVGEPFVDADDIADVVVAALTDRRHVGQLYEVTGPRLMTFAGATAEIARAAGRDIGYRRVPGEAYVAGLREVLPAELAELIGHLFSEVLDGRNASLADGVLRALGRPPRDFADYAREAAKSGVWSA